MRAKAKANGNDCDNN